MYKSCPTREGPGQNLNALQIMTLLQQADGIGVKLDPPIDSLHNQTMLQPLEKYFPRTFLLLSKPERMLVDVEFFKNFTVPRDLRYFPMLLKQMKLKEEVVQTADYEHLRRWVEASEEIPLKSQGKYRLNSTVQWIVLESAAAGLGKEAGLYILWKHQGHVLERKLSEIEAKLISELHEHPELVTTDESDTAIQNFKIIGIIV